MLADTDGCALLPTPAAMGPPPTAPFVPMPPCTSTDRTPAVAYLGTCLTDLSDFIGSGEKAQVLAVEGDEQDHVAKFLRGGLYCRGDATAPPRPRCSLVALLCTPMPRHVASPQSRLEASPRK